MVLTLNIDISTVVGEYLHYIPMARQCRFGYGVKLSGVTRPSVDIGTTTEEKLYCLFVAASSG